MEQILVNTAAAVRRVVRDGTEYLVAPAVILKPGVLNGSRGPLYYPVDEIARNPGVWNGVPLTLRHPSHPVHGAPMSASEDGVQDRVGLGYLANDHVTPDGRRKVEAWFDARRTQALSPEVYNALQRGEPIELSTGLFTDNQPAENGANYQGRPYTHVARNYRPDHLAVLPDQTGACSRTDGCGINLNTKPPTANVHRLRELLTNGEQQRDDRGRFAALKQSADDSDFQAYQHEQLLGKHADKITSVAGSEHGNRHDDLRSAVEAHDGNLKPVDRGESLNDVAKAARRFKESNARAPSTEAGGDDVLSHSEKEENADRADAIIRHASLARKAVKEHLAYRKEMQDMVKRRGTANAGVVNSAKRCPKCGGEEVDGECEDCGYEETNNANPEGYNQYKKSEGEAYKAGFAAKAASEKAGRSEDAEDHARAAEAHTKAMEAHLEASGAASNSPKGEDRPGRALFHSQKASEHMFAAEDHAKKAGVTKNAQPRHDGTGQYLNKSGAGVKQTHAAAAKGAGFGVKEVVRTTPADMVEAEEEEDDHQHDDAPGRTGAEETSRAMKSVTNFNGGGTGPAAANPVAHSFTKQAAHATLDTEHEGASAPAGAAMTASGSGDAQGAQDAHLAAAKQHDKAMGQAVKDDDPHAAEQHANAGALHRKAAAFHKFQQVANSNPNEDTMTRANNSSPPGHLAGADRSQVQAAFAAMAEGGGSETAGAMKASKHANATKSAGAHRSAAEAHRKAADHHRDEGNTEYANGHSDMARKHSQLAHRMSRNSKEDTMTRDQMIANLRGKVCPKEFAALASLNTETIALIHNAKVTNAAAKPPSNNAKAEGSNADVTGGTGSKQAGGSETTDLADYDDDEGNLDPDKVKVKPGKLSANELNELSLAMFGKPVHEVRSTLAFNAEAEGKEKLSLVRRLVANVADAERRKALGSKFLKLDIADLRERVSILPPEPEQLGGRFSQNAQADDLAALYLGAGGGPVATPPQRTDNAVSPEEVNEFLPTLNMKELSDSWCSGGRKLYQGQY